jgi:hypothetical protein
MKKVKAAKKKKFFLKKKIFWIFFLSMLVLASGLYAFLFWEKFQIKEVRMMGEENELSSSVRSFVEERMGEFSWTGSIFLFNGSLIEEGLGKEFPEIKKISVEKTIPDTLNIFIEERKEAALWNFASEFYSMDEEGIIFRITEEVENIPVILDMEYTGLPCLGDKVIDEEKLAGVLSISRGIEDIGRMELEKMIILNGKRLNAVMQEGWEVYFNLEEDLAWQITKLKLLMQEEISLERRETLEYIDLRFEKAFYK